MPSNNEPLDSLAIGHPKEGWAGDRLVVGARRIFRKTIRKFQS